MRGTPITVLCRSSVNVSSLWAYVVSVLRSLGFRVQLHCLDEDQFFAHLLSGQFLDHRRYRARPWQMIYGSGWVADFRAASNFYFGVFGCDVPLAPRGHFCDRTVEATAREAASLEGSDPARSRQLWQQVDRALTDAAAFVPLTNDFESVVVSARLGNVQTDPWSGPLLDQMWVR